MNTQLPMIEKLPPTITRIIIRKPMELKTTTQKNMKMKSKIPTISRIAREI